MVILQYPLLLKLKLQGEEKRRRGDSLQKSIIGESEKELTLMVRDVIAQ